MLNLSEIAARLDEDENLLVKYRVSVNLKGNQENQIRTDRLLDVAEENGILYVEQNGAPVWLKADEVIEIISETAGEGGAADH